MTDDLHTIVPANPLPAVDARGRRNSTRARLDLASIVAAPRRRRMPIARLTVAGACAVAAALLALVMVRVGPGHTPSPATPATGDSAPWAVTATIRVRPWPTAKLSLAQSTERATAILTARAKQLGYSDFRVETIQRGELRVHIGGATELSPLDELLLPADLEIYDFTGGTVLSVSSEVRRLIPLLRPGSPDVEPTAFLAHLAGHSYVLQRSRQRVEAYLAATPTKRDSKIIPINPPDVLLRDNPEGERTPYVLTDSPPRVSPDEVLGARRLDGGEIALRLTDDAAQRVRGLTGEAIRAFATTAGTDTIMARGTISRDHSGLASDEVRLTEGIDGAALVPQMEAGGLAANLIVEEVSRQSGPPEITGPPATDTVARRLGRIGVTDVRVALEADTPYGPYRLLLGGPDEQLWTINPNGGAGLGSGHLRPATWRMQVAGVGRLRGMETEVTMRLGLTGVTGLQAHYPDGSTVAGWAANNVGLLILEPTHGAPDRFEALDATGAVVATVAPDDNTLMLFGKVPDPARTVTGP